MNYQTLEITVDTDDWAIRSAYWNSKSQLEIPKRKRREKAKTGLVLTGHGLSIRVDKGRLFIKGGFTHYPQKQIIKTYFKGALDIPPRIVIVDGKGSITFDALAWMSEQNVDLIRLTYDGHIQSVMVADGYASDPKKVAWQNKMRASEETRLKFAIPLIKKKIRESLFNLENLLPVSASRDKAILKSKELLGAFKSSPPHTVSELLAIEGTAAQGYFFAWRALNLKWKSTNAYPIPEEWRRFFSRSSLYVGNRGRIGNRFATHPINAMLNYVYGMLESQVRIQAIAEGCDPSLGILHDRPNSERHSFVFDQMEPFRPIVDRTVLKLIHEETFSGPDFELQSDGVLRLNPELVRLLVTPASW